MITPIVGIVTALGLYAGRQVQDTVLTLRPPAAKCAPGGSTRNDASSCAGFTGPGWLTRNPLPGYSPLLVYAGAEYAADLIVVVDSLGAVARFEDRDSVMASAADGRKFFSALLANTITKWRFLPASRDGRPVPSLIRVLVLWSREYCGSPGGPTQVQSTARVGVAALVVEVAACAPPLPPPGVVY